MRENDIRTVRVYFGEGATRRHSLHLVELLSQILIRRNDRNPYHVSSISPEETISGEWRHNAVLYVVGGGYDRGLINALGNTGAEQIRNFVAGGGSYLGICSGAYYACESIRFDEGGPLEVCGDRSLKLFPGVGVGPVYGPYCYADCSGSSARVIRWCGPPWDAPSCRLPSPSFFTYYEGGGAFIPKSQFVEHSVEKREDGPNKYKLAFRDASSVPTDQFEGLATFELEGKPWAVVAGKAGKGAYVLSGSHIEMSSDFLAESNDAHLQTLVDKVRPFDSLRFDAFKSILRYCRLEVPPSGFPPPPVPPPPSAPIPRPSNSPP